MTDIPDHLYECPGPPNDDLRIVHWDRPTQFGGVFPGTIWCWSHGAWEDIPDDVRLREAQLRKVIRGTFARWQHRQHESLPQLIRFPPLLGEQITEYTTLLGWKRPDMNDRYTVFRFIDRLPPED